MASRAWYDFVAVCTGAPSSDRETSGDPASWCHNGQRRDSRLANNTDRFRDIVKRTSISQVDFGGTHAAEAMGRQATPRDMSESWIPEYSDGVGSRGEQSRQSPELSRKVEYERRKREAIFKHGDGPPVPTPSTRSPASEAIDPSPGARVDRFGCATPGSTLDNLKSMAFDAFGEQEGSTTRGEERRGVEAAKSVPPDLRPISVPPLPNGSGSKPGSIRGSGGGRRTPPVPPLPDRGSGLGMASGAGLGTGLGGRWEVQGVGSGAGGVEGSGGGDRAEVHIQGLGLPKVASPKSESLPSAAESVPSAAVPGLGGREGQVADEAADEEAAGHESGGDSGEGEGGEMLREESWVGEMPEVRGGAGTATGQRWEGAWEAEGRVSNESEEDGGEDEEDVEEGRWEVQHKHPQSFGRSARVPAVVALFASGTLLVSFPSRSSESFGTGRLPGAAPQPQTSPREASVGAREPPPPTSSNQHTNNLKGNGGGRKGSWLWSLAGKDSPRKQGGRRASKLSSGSGARRRSQSWATLGLPEAKFHCSDLRDATHKFLGPSEGGALKLMFGDAAKLKLEGPHAEKVLEAVRGKAALAMQRRRFQGGRLLHLRRLARTQVSWTDAEHRGDLQRLWSEVFDVAMPEGSLEMEVSPGWKDMGFQSNDPCTDFRAMGRLALGCLSYMVRHYKPLAAAIVVEGSPKRDYPFGAVGVNIVAGLMGLVGLGLSDPEVAEWDQMPESHLLSFLCRLSPRRHPRASTLNTALTLAPANGPSPSTSTVASSRPTPRGSEADATLAGAEGLVSGRWEGAGDSGVGAEGAGMAEGFEEVFCATFELLDAIWVRDRPANILFFNEVLDHTWDYLKEALASPHITSMEDLRDELRAKVPRPDAA